MKTPVFLGQIVDGKPVLKKPEVWDLLVSSFEEGTFFEQIFRKVRASRSKQQRGYYWGVMIPPLCQKTGLSPDEMNETLKLLFNPKKVTIGGVETVIGMSIENESTKRVEEIYKAIREWSAADPNIHTYIPLPRETDWLLNY